MAQPSNSERLFIKYNDVILPEQTLNIEGFPSLAGTFSHNTEKLQQAGRDTIDADFILAACITYKVLGSDALHATGFALKAQSLNFRAPKYDPEPILIEIGKKGDVKITPPILFPAPYGNFAD